MRPLRNQLSDGNQHFSWGPIDLIIGAKADIHNQQCIAAAHDAAWQRFQQILPELVSELDLLQSPIQLGVTQNGLTGLIAQNMWHACQPFCEEFITPMAAVAGAVADHILEYYKVPGILKAWVNNGGDAAFYLTRGQTLPIGLCSNAYQTYNQIQNDHFVERDAKLTISATDPVRGIATSGWQGRSFSMGIADSVTVLASNAAAADAAATIIANAVNLQDDRIERKRACDVKDNSDLGDRLITVHVPQLEYPLIKQALEKGLEVAQLLQNDHLIWGCILNCQNQVQSIFSQSIFSNSYPNHRQINNSLYAPSKKSFDLINATL